MLEYLKSIKLHNALFIAFTVSVVCAIFSDLGFSTKNTVLFINFGTCFFILSGITYRFKNLFTEHKTFSSDEKLHFSGMIFFTLLIFFFFSDKTQWGDDVIFKTYLDNSTLHHYLTERYNIWSSRILIETVLISIVKANTYLWRVITTILVTVIVECVISLFVSEKNRKYSFIAYLLAILTIPVITLCDAGWFATTINYLWPFAAFMTLMIIVKKMFCNEKTNGFENAQAIVLTLFASNAEPIVLSIVCILALLFFYKKYETKKSIKELAKETNKLYFIILCVSFIELLFTLLAPGNANRVIYETSNWYPEFANFNIIDKIKLGIVSTMPFFYANKIALSNVGYPTNFIILILMLFTCIKLWDTRNKKILCLQSLGILIVLYNQFYIVMDGFGKQLDSSWYILANFKIGTKSDIGSGLLYLEIFIYLVTFVSLIIGVYNALGKKKNALLACVILLAGICTRLIMGFSPTVYASGVRTFLLSEISFLIVAIMVINELISDERRKNLTLATFAASMLYIFLLSPKSTIGTESENKIELVSFEDLNKLPIHENNNARNAFRIDANNNSLQPENEDVLDFDPEKGICLTGWAFDIEDRKALSDIFIVIGNKCIKATYGSKREDVAKAFQVDENVGFSINIPRELILDNKEKIYEISFFVVNSSNEFKYNSIPFRIRYPQTEERKLSGNNLESGFHIEACNNIPQKEGVFNLILDKKSGINIGGWAIDYAKKERLGGIQAIIGDTTINASYGVERKDVADFFKMEDKQLGFYLQIPIDVFNKRQNTSKIEFILLSKKLDYKYEPIVYTITK